MPTSGGGSSGAGAPPALDYAGPAYRYSETLEPNSHGTVVALEMTAPPPDASITQSADYQLISRRPILQSRSYELVAYPLATDRGALSDETRQIDLALPRDRNPRSRALAENCARSRPTRRPLSSACWHSSATAASSTR